MQIRRPFVLLAAVATLATTLVASAASPAAAADVSRWFFTDHLIGGEADSALDFGSDVDRDFYVGDWDGDGVDDLARRDGTVFTLLNLTTRTTSKISYGLAGDEVFVGDWDGDGVDTFAVRRGNLFHVKNSVSSGPADVVVGYGKSGDEVFVGDWDGNGVDTFAVRRGNVFFVRNSVSTGNAHVIFGYGKAADEVYVGDWNASGSDTFVVRRGNTIYVRNDFRTAPAEFSFGFGKASDELHPGDWNGDRVDTFAVRRVVDESTPLPAPDPPTAGEAYALGDSVMLGAEGQLLAAGIDAVDATVSRQFVTAPGIISGLSGMGYSTLVLHLGTNGAFTKATFDATIQAALDAGFTHIVVITIQLPDSNPAYVAYEGPSNTIIEQGAGEWGLSLVDWNAITDANPDYLAPDGFHMKPNGAAVYADLIVDAF